MEICFLSCKYLLLPSVLLQSLQNLKYLLSEALQKKIANSYLNANTCLFHIISPLRLSAKYFTLKIVISSPISIVSKCFRLKLQGVKKKKKNPSLWTFCLSKTLHLFHQVLHILCHTSPLESPSVFKVPTHCPLSSSPLEPFLDPQVSFLFSWLCDTTYFWVPSCPQVYTIQRDRDLGSPGSEGPGFL